MDIKRLSAHDPFLLETAPPEALYEGEDKKTDLLGFGGYLEDELWGYALFALEPDSEIVKLRYLYTVPEHRRQGIAKDLIRHACAFFKKRHKPAIPCRLLQSPEEISLTDDILYRCGFVPVSLLDRFFVYEAEDLLDAAELTGFHDDQPAEPFPAQIRGKILYVEIDEKTTGGASGLTRRITASLRQAREPMGDDFRVVLHFTKPESFEKIVAFLGQPEEHYLIHDLCLLLEAESL